MTAPSRFEVRVSIVDRTEAERAQPGDYLLFEIVDEDPANEFRFLMQNGALLHATPILDWSRERRRSWQSPSPGRYRFWIERRRAAEPRRWIHRLGFARPRAAVANGLESVDLEVEGHAGLAHEPTRVRTPEGIELWIPSAWEAGQFREYEPEFRRALRELVRPGDAIFDIGANLGAHTVELARATGPAGRVFAFEANPVCVAFLLANLEANGVENAVVLPVAAGAVEGAIELAVDFGNSALGTISSSPLFHGKSGQRVAVDCRKIDDLVDRGLVAAPDLMKIDIEGGELLALYGMERLLRSRRPCLILELHGPHAGWESLKLLDRLGYRHRYVSGEGGWFQGADLRLEEIRHVVQVVSEPAPGAG
jgi:FkbM family methyltransferase